MRFILKISIVIACLLVFATQAGCLVVAAAAGTGATVAYVRGDLETTLEASPKDVAAATEQAFKDLELALITKETSNLDAKLIARTARDVKMTVVVKGQSSNLSKISVRAGVFGDGSMQERVLNRIRENLGIPVENAGSSTTQPSQSASS